MDFVKISLSLACYCWYTQEKPDANVGAIMTTLNKLQATITKQNLQIWLSEHDKGRSFSEWFFSWDPDPAIAALRAFIGNLSEKTLMTESLRKLHTIVFKEVSKHHAINRLVIQINSNAELAVETVEEALSEIPPLSRLSVALGYSEEPLVTRLRVACAKEAAQPSDPKAFHDVLRACVMPTSVIKQSSVGWNWGGWFNFFVKGSEPLSQSEPEESSSLVSKVRSSFSALIPWWPADANKEKHLKAHVLMDDPTFTVLLSNDLALRDNDNDNDNEVKKQNKLTRNIHNVMVRIKKPYEKFTKELDVSAEPPKGDLEKIVNAVTILGEKFDNNFLSDALLELIANNPLNAEKIAAILVKYDLNLELIIILITYFSDIDCIVDFINEIDIIDINLLSFSLQQLKGGSNNITNKAIKDECVKQKLVLDRANEIIAASKSVENITLLSADIVAATIIVALNQSVDFKEIVDKQFPVICKAIIQSKPKTEVPLEEIAANFISAVKILHNNESRWSDLTIANAGAVVDFWENAKKETKFTPDVRLNFFALVKDNPQHVRIIIECKNKFEKIVDGEFFKNSKIKCSEFFSYFDKVEGETNASVPHIATITEALVILFVNGGENGKVISKTIIDKILLLLITHGPDAIKIAETICNKKISQKDFDLLIENLVEAKDSLAIEELICIFNENLKNVTELPTKAKTPLTSTPPAHLVSTGSNVTNFCRREPCSSLLNQITSIRLGVTIGK